MGVVSAIFGFLGKIAGPVLKLVPFLGAYLFGKTRTESKVNKDTLEAKERGEKAENKVKEEIRDSSVGDYVRKNDI